MKIHEVMLKVIGGQRRWVQAAEILGISARTMHRWKQRYERQGYDGLFDRYTHQPSLRRMPLPVVEQVLWLYRKSYYDFNVRHFHTSVWLTPADPVGTRPESTPSWPDAAR
jgi:hypothetical protein